MKILALDIGDVWTGSAYSDPLGITATPFQTIKSKDLETFIAQQIKDQKIETVVVGYPKTMRGTESEQTKKVVSYSIASISGAVLAVCSCTVLPLFSGIYKRGAGLGPATAFLYSGPAINVLAIIMTARILGWQLGLARAVGAIIFSVVIGLLMHIIFIKEERTRKVEGELFAGEVEEPRALWQNALYFAAMVGFLVFANWAKPQEGDTGSWAAIFAAKWYLSAGFLIMIGVMLVKWFKKGEISEWT